MERSRDLNIGTVCFGRVLGSCWLTPFNRTKWTFSGRRKSRETGEWRYNKFLDLYQEDFSDFCLLAEWIQKNSNEWLAERANKLPENLARIVKTTTFYDGAREMQFIDGRIVNSGVWECVKKCGSLEKLVKELADYDVGASTIRAGLYRTNLGERVTDILSDKFNILPEEFSKSVKVFMSEEEIK